MPDVAALVEGIRAGRRADVSRAITLVESDRADHRVAARALLTLLAAPDPLVEEVAQQPSRNPRDGFETLAGARSSTTGPEAGARSSTTGPGSLVEEVAQQPSRNPSVRVGISGVPGVGKSTFIEALGSRLTAAGHRVGVLAVDPSSIRTGGSVLGDKTRMQQLAADPNAFIRPSPTAGTLGGVARATTQAMLVLEAAGYDVVLVETVGVGQSEVTVAGMVDTFCFLTLARTGDQLQGIKKGILEIADVIAVNKADDAGGTQGVAEARSAARELSGALRLVHGSGHGWVPPVLTCSALTGDGVDTVWERVLAHRESLGADGVLTKRAEQQLDFTWSLVRDELDQRLLHSPGVRAIRADLRSELLAGDVVAPVAADRIIAAFDADQRDRDRH